MEKNKKITTSELAVIIKAGFAAADKRTDAKFAAADKRTDAKFEAADKRTDAKFEAADKRTDAKIENLAVMVRNGFDDMGERIDGMKQDIDLLKQGQERIEMRLNNVVYRSELDAVLDRVQILEKQMKIALKKS